MFVNTFIVVSVLHNCNILFLLTQAKSFVRFTFLQLIDVILLNRVYGGIESI